MKLPVKNLIALILSLLLWGTSFPAMKLAINANPPMVILFYRYLFAFVIAVFILLAKYRRQVGELFRCKQLFLLGVFNFLGRSFSSAASPKRRRRRPPSSPS